MLFKFLTKLLLSIKLLRIKKTAAQDRQLAIKLAAINNINTVYDVLDFVHKQMKASLKKGTLFGINAGFIDFLAKRKGSQYDFQLQYMYMQFGAGLEPYCVTLVSKNSKANCCVCIVKTKKGLYVLDATAKIPLGPFGDVCEIVENYAVLFKSKYVFVDVRDAWLRQQSMR